MRIVSWNLAHQTHERPIHRDFLEAVKLLSPDVLVLMNTFTVTHEER